jgi:muramoyltetrapeptide carboxypeptidase
MELLKPPALIPGDTIGVVAPAGVVCQSRLRKGVRTLEAHGFRVELAGDILERKGYLAGGEENRAATLSAFIRRDDIGAIFCARGGFGSIQLLPYLDAAKFRSHPKIFVGFSDVTVLLNWFVERCGVVAFHGPMVAVEFTQGLEKAAGDVFWRVLTGGQTDWGIQGSAVVCTGNGLVRAPLLGGCLSVIVTTLGTPYEIGTAGRILFLEDIGERPYRIERMLTQLKMAGKLDDLAGVVTGSFSDCGTGGGKTVDDILWETFRQARYPVVTGLPCGHSTANWLLPFGVPVELDGRAGTLRLPEPVTRARG